jgi:hypothetical protein
MGLRPSRVSASQLLPSPSGVIIKSDSPYISVRLCNKVRSASHFIHLPRWGHNSSISLLGSASWFFALAHSPPNPSMVHARKPSFLLARLTVRSSGPCLHGPVSSLLIRLSRLRSAFGCRRVRLTAFVRPFHDHRNYLQEYLHGCWQYK